MLYACKSLVYSLATVTTAVIPNRPVFRAQEVCELADVQAYVLRTWEAEFPDLGVAKTASGPRVYRRADVERVLRIKHLLFVDGLTLAGARRRMSEEGLAALPTSETVNDADVAAMMDEATRQELLNVRRGLHWILGVLSGDGLTPEDFVLKSPRTDGGLAARSSGRRPAPPAKRAKVRVSKPARSAKKGGKKR
jgi:DNA-binding transcriptional MerR regulator